MPGNERELWRILKDLPPEMYDVVIRNISPEAGLKAEQLRRARISAKLQTLSKGKVHHVRRRKPNG